MKIISKKEIEIFKETMKNIFNSMKEEYLNKNTNKENKMNNLFFEENEEDYKFYIMSKEILTICKDWELKILIGIDGDYFESNIYINHNPIYLLTNTKIEMYNPTDKESECNYQKIISDDERKMNNWLNNFLISNNSFDTKNIKIHLSQMNKTKMVEIFYNFIKDINKETANFSELFYETLKELKENKQMVKKFIECPTLQDYNNFQKRYVKDKNIIYSYSSTSVYLNCLKTDILEINNNIMDIKEESFHKLSINIKNKYIEKIFSPQYFLLFKEDDIKAKVFLYNGEKELLNFSVENYLIAETLYSFIHNDIQYKLINEVTDNNVLILQEEIKQKLSDKFPDIEIKIVLSELMLEKINENSIPIKVIYNNNMLDLLYSNEERDEINKNIEIFIDKVSISGILNNNIEENKKKRL